MRETQNYKLKKIDKEYDKVLASIDYLNFNFDKIDEELKNNKDATSDLNNDLESHKIDNTKHITEDERTIWNNKSDFSGSYDDLKNVPEKFNPAEHNHDESYYKKEEIDEKGFITNVVDNLLNYYLKSETYTKEEVLELINALKRGLFSVVDSLPETGEPYIIYLIPSEDPQEKNVKDEYIWVNENWEKIGSTKIDLSGYATIEQMNQALQQKLNITDIADWAKQENKPTYDYSEIQNTPKEYQLPVASDTVLGGIKAGAGVEIDEEGNLNVTGGGTADAVDWENVQNKPETFTPSAHTHKQSEITDLKIPTKTSELTNDSNFLTEHQNISGKADKTTVDNHIADSMVHVTSAEKSTWNSKAAGSHTHAASQVTAGTLGGQVIANSSAVSSYSTSQIRNIRASTSDLTAGTSTLTTGDIYLVYE